MRVLILDNYDSFTFNLYQSIGEILEDDVKSFSIDVFRNDKINFKKIKESKYDRIVISPGPGNPSDIKYFGVCADVLTKIGKNVKTLGVCLGMQGMAYYFGGKIKKAKKQMHGKTSLIFHNREGLFKNITQGIEVMRYHSLIADPESLPSCLEITAIVNKADVNYKKFSKNKETEIMGLRHKVYPIEGIQFHPESFATEEGKTMLKNFLFL